MGIIKAKEKVVNGKVVNGKVADGKVANGNFDHGKANPYLWNGSNGKVILTYRGTLAVPTYVSVRPESVFA